MLKRNAGDVIAEIVCERGLAMRKNKGRAEGLTGPAAPGGTYDI